MICYRFRLRSADDLGLQIKMFAFLLGLCSVFTLVTPQAALAASPDYADNDSAHEAFGSFLRTVSSLFNNIFVSGSEVSAFIEAFFLFGVIYKLVSVVASYMLRTGNLADLFQAVILIAIVRALLDGYGVVTSALFGWSQGFAGVIQLPIVGNSDVFFLTDYVQNIVNTIWHEDASIFDGIKLTVATGVLWLLLTTLNVLSFFAVAWAAWGFILAKLVGMIFLPFLLFERTAFLFDGWLRFFVGFLIFAVIARINLLLVLVLLTSYFDLPLDAATGPLRTYPIANVDDIGGLLSLLVIAVVSLISSGRFATALAGGVGGFGSAVSSLSRSASLSIR